MANPIATVKIWVEDAIEKAQVTAPGNIHLPTITEEIVKKLAEPEYATLRNELLEAAINPVVYTLGQRVIAASRGQIIRFGDRLVRPGTIRQRAIHLKVRWEGFLEHCGPTGHKRLWDMTRGDLTQAAMERRARAGTDLLYANLWDQLAAPLPDGATVGEHYTVEAIEQAYQALQANDMPDASGS